MVKGEKRKKRGEKRKRKRQVSYTEKTNGEKQIRRRIGRERKEAKVAKASRRGREKGILWKRRMVKGKYVGEKVEVGIVEGRKMAKRWKVRGRGREGELIWKRWMVKENNRERSTKKWTKTRRNVKKKERQIIR